MILETQRPSPKQNQRAEKEKAPVPSITHLSCLSTEVGGNPKLFSRMEQTGIYCRNSTSLLRVKKLRTPSNKH